MFKEAMQIARIGLPLIIANIAMVGMEMVDTMMAGQASVNDLSGLAIGVNIWFVVEVFLLGCLSAIAPRIARFYGARARDEITQEVRQSTLLALLLGSIGTAALLACVPFLSMLGTEPAVTRVAEDYLSIVAFSIPAAAVGSVFLLFSEAHGYTRYVMVSSLVALAMNAILDYILVFGKFGLPKMGGVGCAWATLSIFWTWMLVTMIYACIHPKLKEYKAVGLPHNLDWSRWKAILVLGIPISLALLAEEGFFNLSALLIAPLGTTMLGAHQITLQVVFAVLMIGFGIGQATSIRVGQSLGKGDIHKARLQTLTGLLSNVTLALAAGTLVFVMRERIPGIFTREASIITTSSLILMAAPLYCLVDGIQLGAAQILRGYTDTKVPMMLQVFSYWGIGFPLGYSLGNTDFWGEQYGIYGFWSGFLIAIFVAAILMCIRLWDVSMNKEHLSPALTVQ